MYNLVKRSIFKEGVSSVRMVSTNFCLWFLCKMTSCNFCLVKNRNGNVEAGKGLFIAVVMQVITGTSL